MTDTNIGTQSMTNADTSYKEYARHFGGVFADLFEFYSQFNSTVEDGVHRLCRVEWKGISRYAMHVFPGTLDRHLTNYERVHSIALPMPVKRLARRMNGLSAFDLTLFGVPESMCQSVPNLNRSRIQCIDIARENWRWRLHDKGLAGFLFGGRYDGASQEVHISYLVDESNKLFGVNDTTSETYGPWNGWNEFLSSELRMAEQTWVTRLHAVGTEIPVEVLVRCGISKETATTNVTTAVQPKTVTSSKRVAKKTRRVK